MKNFVALAVIMCLFSCQEKKSESLTLELGIYKASLDVQDNEQLPFLFEMTSNTTMKIFNAEEQISVDDITYRNDSIFINMAVYEGYIAAKLTNDGFEGSFNKESLERYVPISAEKSTERFSVKTETSQNVSGNWETVFSPDNENDRYIAKGIFKQSGKTVTGTFRTTTGDYRYLEGVMDGNTMKLSTFDGAHAFLFTATVTDSTMKGMFYSGNHFKEPFVSKRNDTYELPSANTLTYLKEGYDNIEFSFPDETGKQVALTDKRFKDKVVLVQIMGTWCPNCLDESTYYAQFYKDNKDKDIEIVALAFEYAKTEEKAINNIKRLKARTGIEYPVLLAQVGTSSKMKANEKLPMLNHILSYPTTIFIDKTGKVRKIHTGFNGPATGDKYTEFKTEFTSFVDRLLEE